MNNIAEIRQNVDDFEKFKNGIKKFFDKVDEMGQEVSTINNYFSFLSKYGYKASCGFGKGKLSYKPFVVFIRIDSGYDSASKGVYCRVNIERGTDNVSVEINESETNKIQYKAQRDCKQYNKDKPCKFKRNDLDDIVEQVLKDMEWFANLPLDSIKDNAITTIKPQNGEEKPQPDINKGDSMKTTPPLNQILYGPPGTGKTYSTIDKALEILGYAKSNDNGKVILDYTKIKQKLQNIADNKNGAGLDLKNLDSKNDRELAKLLFDYYRSPEHNKEQKQIEFVTFHQSFSYEEFVEGIKPKLIDSSEGAESSEMSYTIKSGIFKEICKSALENLQDSQKDEATLSAENQVANLFETFIEHIQNEQENGKEYILDNEKNWFISILYSSSSPDYRIIKIFSNSGYLQKYPHFLNDDKIKRYYKDFKSNHNFKIPSKENRTGYIDTHRFYTAFFKKMQEFETTWAKHNNQTKTNIDNALKPYILIIDEINRGNISKILGELITLIEPSKRIGASDEEKARGIGNESLEVTLPYSNETFGVPSNLYIIGTMNTADRSIALLDTALRRRFEFIEMMPQWDNEHISTDCEGVNLQELLKTMNERIEFLLDREHTIGHSFFIGVDSLGKLREVFKLKIIPLLQEYFYDDYAKIQAVLNDNKMVKSKSMGDLGVNLSDNFVDSEKRVYRITDSSAWNVETFTKIYE